MLTVTPWERNMLPQMSHLQYVVGLCVLDMGSEWILVGPPGKKACELALMAQQRHRGSRGSDR